MDSLPLSSSSYGMLETHTQEGTLKTSLRRVLYNYGNTISALKRYIICLVIKLLIY